MNTIGIVTDTREHEPPWSRPAFFEGGPPRAKPKFGPVIPYALGVALLAINGILVWYLYPYILQGSALVLVVASCVVAILLIFYANVMQRYETDRNFEDFWFRALEDAGKAARDREHRYFELAKQIVAAQEDDGERNGDIYYTDDDDS